VAQIRPRVVAIVGVTAYRAGFGRPRAQLGEQAGGLAGRPLWVLPNPSGLNAHHRVEDLADWYRSAWASACAPAAQDDSVRCR
jgi:TDG/mug DNA glycosylase family protein